MKYFLYITILLFLSSFIFSQNVNIQEEKPELTGTSFTHKCMHDDIVKKFKHTHATKRLDYDTQQNFKNMRIFLDPSQISIPAGPTRDYLINSLLPYAIKFLSTAFSVIPVQGNLTFQKPCEFINPNTGECVQFQDPPMCNDITIPNRYFNPGVKGYDLVVLVATNPLDSSVLANAVACQFDQKGRPIGGRINFNPTAIIPSDVGGATWQSQLGVTIHELTHVLGFSSDMFPNYLKPDGTKWGKVTQTFNERGDTVTKIVTPKALKAAATHFGCSNLNGAELENHGGSGSAGSHWKARIYNYEFMQASSDGTDPVYYSPLTLALLEDSGWYQANYTAATDTPWGKGKGCDFALNKCVNSGKTSFPDHFCTTTDTLTCSLDKIARVTCNLGQFTTALPSAYQYFSDPTKGGTNEFMDYCPEWGTFRTSDTQYSICTEASNAPDTNYWGETYGPSSRCFQGTLVDASFNRFFQNQGAACYTYSCAGGRFLVKIGKKQVDCTKPGTITVDGFNGNFVCPPTTGYC